MELFKATVSAQVLPCIHCTSLLSQTQCGPSVSPCAFQSLYSTYERMSISPLRASGEFWMEASSLVW